MLLVTKEHYDIIDAFERSFPHVQKTKEDKSMWSKGYVYTNGDTNNLFIAFRHGAAFAKAYFRD